MSRQYIRRSEAKPFRNLLRFRVYHEIGVIIIPPPLSAIFAIERSADFEMVLELYPRLAEVVAWAEYPEPYGGEA